MNIPDFSNLKSPQWSERYFTFHYPEFKDYLYSTYPADITFSEKIYWYINNIKTYPLCPECGRRLKLINARVGYQKYCSKKCANSNIEKKALSDKIMKERWGGYGNASSAIREKIIKTNLERYGVEDTFQSKSIREQINKTILERYGGMGNASEVIKEKVVKTNLERYGVDNYAKTSECHNKMKQTNLKRYGVDSYSKTEQFKVKYKETCMKNFGVENYTKTDEYHNKTRKTNLKKFGAEHYSKTDDFKDRIKKTNIARYGVDNYAKHIDFPHKQYQTKKQNNSFHTSSIEQEFKLWLDDNNINYIYQYKSEAYPFTCDFYFPDHDLYIEINASWTHGPHPFDADSEDDMNLLTEWKSKNTEYYDNAIECWTIRDPKKIAIAKKHNLNVLFLYVKSASEVINEYERYCS